MKTDMKLSRMDCYAGKIHAETMPHEPDIHDEPGVYVQFREGCGHTVYTMTPDEADEYADMLKVAAAHTRKAFQKKKR